MGLFGKKNKDKQEREIKSGTVEKIGANSEELQDLLKEFKEMRAGVKPPEEETEEVYEDVEGEEYELPEEDSESIENFLNGNDEVEEEIVEDETDTDEIIEDDVDEVEDEEPVEEIIDEEPVQTDEELLSEEPVEEVEIEEEISDFDEPVEEETNDIEELEVEDEILDESATELQEEEIEEEEPVEGVENAEVEEPIEEEIEEDITDAEAEEPVIEDLASEPQEEEIAEEVVEEKVEPEKKTQGGVAKVSTSEGVSAEELDQKFNDFEKRLLDKIMQQFMAVQSTKAEVKEQPTKVVETAPALGAEDGELEISTKDGHLVINGYTFMGEVVMFTPLESLKKATWEEVVRRKGHCTYHLTTSGNGGWFIKKSNAPNPYAYIENKEDAEALAKIYAQREKAELKIHNSKGVIEKSLSFGREKLRG